MMIYLFTLIRKPEARGNSRKPISSSRKKKLSKKKKKKKKKIEKKKI